jgi:thioesterase domain-containing protein
MVMPLEQLANIAEIFGMIVITITLIFMTVQMRQNAVSLKSAATRETHAQYARFYEILATNDAVRDTFVKGTFDPAALSETDTSRFFSFWMMATIQFQNWIHQTQSGAMDAELLNSYSIMMQRVVSSPGWTVFWEDRKSTFSPMAQKHIEALIQRGPDRPYRPLGVS